MIIKTIENKEGFCMIKSDFTLGEKEIRTKKTKLYKWGDSLIELANADFSKLKDLLYNDDIPTYITYKEFFTKYLELNIDSIYYLLIKFYIVRFMLERIELLNMSLDLNISYNTLEIYEPNIFFSDFRNLILPLLYCHEKVKNILELLVCNNEKNKNRKKIDILKNSKDKLSSFYFDYDSKITQFDTEKIYSNFKYIVEKNKLFMTHTYYSIPELCNYDLFRFIHTKTKIIKCKECEKFIIVSSAKKTFCDKSCNELYLKRNPFYYEYRKTYQSIHKLHYEDGCVEPWTTDVKPKLKKLLNEYTTYLNTPEQDSKLEEFKNKLFRIKNK